MAGRTAKLAVRRTDPLVETRGVHEIYARINQSDAVKYIVGAMQPIEPEYTANTYDQAKRVVNQLEKKLQVSCSFDYQGSVTNDTHIKARSDIDVLTLTEIFFSLEAPQQPVNPYTGDVIDDLMKLREGVKEILTSSFPEATVDASGSKSISIEGGSLRRKIDVVPANWFNTNDYAQSQLKRDRGIQILDSKAKTRLLNKPFLHNDRIATADTQAGGGLRRAARLLKSVKYDEDISLSSYDVVSIAYNIPLQDLAVPKGLDLLLFENCLTFCQALSDDATFRDRIYVPDGHRKVFVEGHATPAALKSLVAALHSLKNDVLTENARSFKKLAEARVDY